MNNVCVRIDTDGRFLDLGKTQDGATIKQPAPKAYFLYLTVDTPAEAIITAGDKEIFKQEYPAGTHKTSLDLVLPDRDRCQDARIEVVVTLKKRGRVVLAQRYCFTDDTEEAKIERPKPDQSARKRMLEQAISRLSEQIGRYATQRINGNGRLSNVLDVLQSIAELAVGGGRMMPRRAHLYIFERDALAKVMALPNSYWFCRVVIEAAKSVDDGMTPIPLFAVQEGIARIREEEGMAALLEKFRFARREDAVLLDLIAKGAVVVDLGSMRRGGPSMNFVANPALLDAVPSVE